MSLVVDQLDSFDGKLPPKTKPNKGSSRKRSDAKKDSRQITKSLEVGLHAHHLSENSIPITGNAVSSIATISLITLPNYIYQVLDRIRNMGRRNVAIMITNDLLQCYIRFVLACVEAKIQCAKTSRLLNAHDEFRVIARPNRDDRDKLNSACSHVLAPFALLFEQIGVTLSPLIIVPDLREPGDPLQFINHTADEWISFFYAASLKDMNDFMIFIRAQEPLQPGDPLMLLLRDPLHWWAGRPIDTIWVSSVNRRLIGGGQRPQVFRLDPWFDLYRFDVSDAFYGLRNHDTKMVDDLSLAFKNDKTRNVTSVNLIDGLGTDTQCVRVLDISNVPATSEFLKYYTTDSVSTFAQQVGPAFWLGIDRLDFTDSRVQSIGYFRGKALRQNSIDGILSIHITN